LGFKFYAGAEINTTDRIAVQMKSLTNDGQHYTTTILNLMCISLSICDFVSKTIPSFVLAHSGGDFMSESKLL